MVKGSLNNVSKFIKFDIGGLPLLFLTAPMLVEDLSVKSLSTIDLI